jgi:hypothetical protein
MMRQSLDHLSREKRGWVKKSGMENHRVLDEIDLN